MIEYVARSLRLYCIFLDFQKLCNIRFDSYAGQLYPIGIRLCSDPTMENSKEKISVPARQIIRSSLALEKKIMGDLILLHQPTGNYYMLNSTGAAIWNYCCESRQWEEVLDFVACTFQAEEEPDLQDDINAYLEELLQAGLLEIVPDASIQNIRS